MSRLLRLSWMILKASEMVISSAIEMASASLAAGMRGAGGVVEQLGDGVRLVDC
jgi:hypothetical protein